ncbi:hypothetical protein [Natrinema sp. SYSU A 869]|uniref:hypothetical protein n=1 Tax=Natrinema sp. SYSU A 869 TaxID=2871694 RepID=UPI001CA45E2B|nr:hypothetical protein [Natrinema sp. SYSU A 869]
MTNDASSASEPTNEQDPDDSSVLPDCPSCGEPIITTTVVGPMDAYAAPCGCRVSPAALPGLGDE